jgi:amidophosphoribosyltransferase
MYEIDPGKALIIKKNGTVSMQEITTVKKACSFEHLLFESDAEIYQERKI